MKGATLNRLITPSTTDCFNPRTREGCDEGFPFCPRCTEDVSIHAPVKGATFRPDRWFNIISGFNPRTREGCDEATNGRSSKNKCVSIHAPVKGATSHCSTPYHLRQVSIHAPVKGATAHPTRSYYPHSCFNPRTREGCDKISGCDNPVRSIVSIHAPVKGATHRWQFV